MDSVDSAGDSGVTKTAASSTDRTDRASTDLLTGSDEKKMHAGQSSVPNGSGGGLPGTIELLTTAWKCESVINGEVLLPLTATAYCYRLLLPLTALLPRKSVSQSASQSVKYRQSVSE